MTITKKRSKLKNMMRSTAAESFNFRISIISWRSKHLVGRAKNYWQRHEFSQGSWMCAISEPYFYYTAEQTCDFFATLLQKELNSNHIPPSTTHEKNLSILLLACVASVERGRENWACARPFLPRARPNFPFPFPFPFQRRPRRLPYYKTGSNVGGIRKAQHRYSTRYATMLQNKLRVS